MHLNASRTVKTALAAAVVTSALIFPTADAASAANPSSTTTLGIAANPANGPQKRDVGVASDKCTGKPKSHILYKYYRGPRVATVLRCGTRTWGYRHLLANGRWSSNFNRKITQAVSTGDVNVVSPGEVNYETWQQACPRKLLFKVVTNPNAYGADPRINPQGIISAYKPRASSSSTC